MKQDDIYWHLLLEKCLHISYIFCPVISVIILYSSCLQLHPMGPVPDPFLCPCHFNKVLQEECKQARQYFYYYVKVKVKYIFKFIFHLVRNILWCSWIPSLSKALDQPNYRAVNKSKHCLLSFLLFTPRISHMATIYHLFALSTQTQFGFMNTIIFFYQIFSFSSVFTLITVKIVVHFDTSSRAIQSNIIIHRHHFWPVTNLIPVFTLLSALLWCLQ